MWAYTTDSMDFVTVSTGLILPYWMGLPIRYIQLILESGQDEAKQEPENTINKEDTTYAFTRGTEYYGGKK